MPYSSVTNWCLPLYGRPKLVDWCIVYEHDWNTNSNRPVLPSPTDKFVNRSLQSKNSSSWKYTDAQFVDFAAEAHFCERVGKGEG